MDNCEHVIEAAASLVEHVLTRCGASSVLATSRSPLRLPDEDVVIVAPLPTVPGGAQRHSSSSTARWPPVDR
jgi:predicted ATPase